MFNPNEHKPAAPITDTSANNIATSHVLAPENLESTVISDEIVDMNAIINDHINDTKQQQEQAHYMAQIAQQKTAKATKDLDDTTTNKGFSIENLTNDIVPEVTQHEETGEKGESSSAFIEKLGESTVGFDLSSLTDDAVLPDSAIASDKENNTSDTDHIHKNDIINNPKRSLLKRALGLVLMTGGLYGLYFLAAIFYPVEVQQAQQVLQSFSDDILASVLGEKDDQANNEDSKDSDNKEAGTAIETVTEKETSQQSVPLVEEYIPTPIADSIAAQDTIQANNPRDTITVSNQTSQAWEEEFPQQTTPITTSTTIDTNYDESFGDLEDAFMLSDGALDDYVARLDQVKDSLERKQGEYKATRNTRGLAIVKTILSRIDSLQAMLLDDDNTTIRQTIEDDINELNKLLDALNK